MNTRVASLDEIPLAAALLRQGLPIVFPTETVYGLGAPVFLSDAVSKIFSIKGRPSDNPLIAHVHSVEAVLNIAEELPRSFFLLAERFWPGPLAMILKRKEAVPSIVSAGHPTIAVRMPDHKGALELIELVGQPLAAPSANLSGRPSPTCAMDAWEDLSGKVPLILDGGPCRIGIESTVVSLASDEPVLLRPGQVAQWEIEEVLKQRVVLPQSGGPILSPGMKYRHYAPKAKIRLVYERNEIKAPFVLSRNPISGERLLSSQTLYAAFREADRLGVSSIDIYCDPSIQTDSGLFNRIARAAYSCH